MASDIVMVGTEEVDLDPARLNFNEANLSQYLMSEASWYNYFGQKLAELEWMLDCVELEYEAKWAALWIIQKEIGGTEKTVEARCDSDKELLALRLKAINFQKLVNKMKQHLKAWDKNHENAQSVGHTLRREMDKLNTDIRFFNPSDRNLSDRVDAIIKESE
jgi:hypothetical protein